MLSEIKPINFMRGVPAPETHPLALVSALMPQVLEKYGDKLFGYGEAVGLRGLREVLAAKFGVSVEEVLITPGSLMAIELFCQDQLQGDSILVDEPTYDRALRIFERHKPHICGVPMLADGPDLDILEQRLVEYPFKLFYTQPDFQNPSGARYSKAKRHEVIRLAEKHGLVIFEDSPYRHLHYYSSFSTPWLPLRELCPRNGHVVQTGSFSKLISPTPRVGYFIGPGKLVERMAKVAANYYVAPDQLAQAMVCEIYSDPWLADLEEKQRTLYRPRLEACLGALHKYLPDAKSTHPTGGFFVSLRLPIGVSGNAVQAEAKNRQLNLTDGRDFFADPSQGEDFLRLPFCALTPEEIDEGVKRLAEAVEAVFRRTH